MRLAAKRDTSEQLVKQVLEKCGWNVYALSQRGMPDLIVVRFPAVWFVECKTGKGKLRASQRWWDGVLPVVVLRSADEVLAWDKEQR